MPRKKAKLTPSPHSQSVIF